MSKARDLANAGTALGAVSATELAFVDGVTSAIQTQIDGKIGSASAINPTIVDAKGDIIAATAADTVSKLAVGANDTVLTADSSTATGLKWATPAAGGMTLISTTTLSGTQTNLTSIPGTYKSLLLRLTGFYGSATGTMNFYLNNDATNPGYLMSSSFSNSRTITGLGTTRLDTDMHCLNTSIGTTNIIELYIPNYASTSTKKFVTISGATRRDASQNISMGTMFGYWDNTSAVTQINIFGLGTFTAGTALLYGVN